LRGGRRRNWSAFDKRYSTRGRSFANVTIFNRRDWLDAGPGDLLRDIVPRFLNFAEGREG
jgi:hypothetical protein